MDTLTYARPDSTIRFHRLALGALILTFVPITQLIRDWIASPFLHQRFDPGSWLQIGAFSPSFFDAAILLTGVWIVSTTFDRAQSTGVARIAAIALASLYLMTVLLANGIVLLFAIGSSTSRDMLHAGSIACMLGCLLLTSLLIVGIFFMFHLACRANARWISIFSAISLFFSVVATLSYFIIFLVYLALDLSASVLPVGTLSTIHLFSRVASLIHQLAELLLWSTIALWAFRRTSA